MSNLTRRNFTKLASASLGVLGAPLFAPAVIGQAKPKLVVIGGGPAGATVARYVQKDAAGAVDVTLVEPHSSFVTCFFSNLHVGGFRDLNSITHLYDNVRATGIRIRHEMATVLDREKREVELIGRDRLPYDRLVVAPGIDIKFDSVPGYSREPPRSCRMLGRRESRRSSWSASSTRSRTAPPS